MTTAAMTRLRSVRTGAVVSCSEETATRLGSEWKPFDGTSGETEERGYVEWTVKELKAEIAARNIDRDPEHRLPDKGNKAALVAALEDDDNAVTGDDEDPEDDSDESDSDES